ncbi:hypothetical protein DPMN_156679 [Dreissena polymorpha]|uniref:Uncharacterized protein n=1 Tax=Dreissena polymorpha TaxID=45954 RepID=A0A9D4FRN5_DREPO|nr:hypothetical protein DPMN_156679 [Dreissena polymorpha]
MGVNRDSLPYGYRPQKDVPRIRYYSKFQVGSFYLRRAYYLPNPRETELYNLCNRNITVSTVVLRQRDIIESVSWEEPVLGVYGGDNENAPRVGFEPTNSRSLGGHLLHYTTVISTKTYRYVS